MISNKWLKRDRLVLFIQAIWLEIMLPTTSLSLQWTPRAIKRAVGKRGPLSAGEASDDWQLAA